MVLLRQLVGKGVDILALRDKWISSRCATKRPMSVSSAARPGAAALLSTAISDPLQHGSRRARRAASRKSPRQQSQHEADDTKPHDDEGAPRPGAHRIDEGRQAFVGRRITDEAVIGADREI